MIAAVLQARFTSTRLPGKILKPILGKPLLALELERVLRASNLDHVVLATSQDVSDDAVESLVNQINNPNLSCFRGSLDDVLDRFYRAAKPLNPDYVVRLTGDCPLIDPSLIDQVIALHKMGGYDYTSNVHPPTFPDGLDVEVMTWRAAEEAWKKATLKSEREHVTPFLHSQPSRFRIGNLTNTEDLSALRWTVDTPEDFEVVTRIYQALYPINPRFTTSDICLWLAENPEVASLNRRFHRNEGYEKSIRDDLRI